MGNTLGLLRRVLRIAHPAISREEALLIASEECTRKGWPWVEPVRISEGLRSYEILTNADHCGGNVFLVVDGMTATVVRSSFARR